MRLGFGFLELYSWAHSNKLNSPSPGADAKAAECGGNLKAGLAWGQQSCFWNILLECSSGSYFGHPFPSLVPEPLSLVNSSGDLDITGSGNLPVGPLGPLGDFQVVVPASL